MWKHIGFFYFCEYKQLVACACQLFIKNDINHFINNMFLILTNEYLLIITVS